MQKYNLGSGSIRSFVRLVDKDRNNDFSPFNHFAVHLRNSFLLNILGCKRDKAKATALATFVDRWRNWCVRREEFFQLLKSVLV
jgi:hypothetical protein